MSTPSTLPVNFSGWDEESNAKAAPSGGPPATLPSDFGGWDAAPSPTPPAGYTLDGPPAPPLGFTIDEPAGHAQKSAPAAPKPEHIPGLVGQLPGVPKPAAPSMKEEGLGTALHRQGHADYAYLEANNPQYRIDREDKAAEARAQAASKAHGYTGMIAPYSPTATERIKQEVFGGELGNAINNATPGLAHDLGIEGYGRDNGELFNFNDVSQGVGRKTLSSPATAQENVAKGVGRFESSMTTPGNLEGMAAFGLAGPMDVGAKAALSRLISAGFSAQTAYGLYKASKPFRAAIDRGDYATAEKIAGEEVPAAILGGAAGLHATGALHAPEPGPEILPPEISNERALPAPNKPVELQLYSRHPAGLVTGIDRATGLPIVDRSRPAAPERPAVIVAPIAEENPRAPSEIVKRRGAQTSAERANGKANANDNGDQHNIAPAPENSRAETGQAVDHNTNELEARETAARNAALDRGVVQNVALAKAETVHPAGKNHVRAASVNYDGHALLRRLGFGDGQDWNAVTLGRGSADALLTVLNGLADQFDSLSAKHSVRDLVKNLKASRAPKGTLVLYLNAPDHHTVGEEQFHAWQIASGAAQSEKVHGAIENDPLFQQAADVIRQEGYHNADVGTLVNELAAKAANESLINRGIKRHELSAFLQRYFSLVRQHLGQSALEDVPATSDIQKEALHAVTNEEDAQNKTPRPGLKGRDDKSAAARR